MQRSLRGSDQSSTHTCCCVVVLLFPQWMASAPVPSVPVHPQQAAGPVYAQHIDGVRLSAHLDLLLWRQQQWSPFFLLLLLQGQHTGRNLEVLCQAKLQDPTSVSLLRRVRRQVHQPLGKLHQPVPGRRVHPLRPKPWQDAHGAGWDHAYHGFSQYIGVSRALFSHHANLRQRSHVAEVDGHGGQANVVL